MSIQKCIIPAQKLHNFQKLPQTKNGKLYFPLTFQKVELRNSTFSNEGLIYILGWALKVSFELNFEPMFDLVDATLAFLATFLLKW